MNPPAPPAHLDAAGILRSSKSSFAPAFRFLPADRREDLVILYAFCRLADDLADAGDHENSARRAALDAWRVGFMHPDLAGLPDNLRELVRRRSLDPELFLELLDGTATDLESPVRMATRADLDLYCHRVAGVVGLLCLPLFGADRQRCAAYAETLGRALQYTNILRDTASDLRRGRIYYPLDEMAEAGLHPENFTAEHARRQGYLERFAAGAAELFARAEALLPAPDRHALRAARIMASTYGRLLRKMRRDGLRVMERRYRLSAPEKLAAFVGGLLAG